MINQIHFNTFGGGLISMKAYNLIYIYILIQFPFVLFVLFAVNLPLCALQEAIHKDQTREFDLYKPGFFFINGALRRLCKPKCNSVHYLII